MGNAVTALKDRGFLVSDISSYLNHGGIALSDVPALLKRLLEDDGWRHFETKLGREVTYENFAEFVTTPPLAGLGATVELVERVVKDDRETVTLLRRALKHQGAALPLYYNESSQGTRADYACDVIERERPDLFAEIVAGNLSPHRAMVIAGHRPERASIRLDDMVSAANTLRKKLSRTQLLELAHLLATEPGGD